MSDTASDDDDDLRRAIALSLQQCDTQTVIDLVSDEEVPTVIGKQAGKATLSNRNLSDVANSSHALRDRIDNNRPKNGSLGVRSNGSAEPEMPNSVSAELFVTNQSRQLHSGLLGLDRRRMEEERLARIRKRKGSISP